MSTTPEQRAYWRQQAEQEVSDQASAHLPRRFSAVTVLALLDDLEAAVAEAAENADMATEFERLRDTMNDSFNHVEAERDRLAGLLRKVRAAVEWSEDVELLAEIDAALSAAPPAGGGGGT